MGDPVRIVDLAKDLITLSGLEPERDIEIKFTGPRPGEKLFEELLNSETRVLPTRHEKIMVVQSEPADLAPLQAEIAELVKVARKGDEAAVSAKVVALVPGYVNGQPAALADRERAAQILILCANAYHRIALKRILQNRYRVLEAATDREGLEKTAAARPDLVIADFRRSRARVRRLCQRIREHAAGAGEAGRPTPVIVLLESGEALSLEEARALGADDRIYSPFPVEIVEKRVASLLERAGHPAGPAS